MSESTIDYLRDSNGMLPSFASIGGYAMYYLSRHGDVWCPDCANRPVSDYDDPAVYGGAYWEGPDMECDDCGTWIKSAYGDPTEDN